MGTWTTRLRIEVEPETAPLCGIFRTRLWHRAFNRCGSGIVGGVVKVIQFIGRFLVGAIIDVFIWECVKAALTRKKG